MTEPTADALARVVAADLMRFVRGAQGMTHDERAWYIEEATRIVHAHAEAARTKERERCAKIARRDADPYYEEVPWQTVAINIAAAVRAQKEETP